MRQSEATTRPFKSPTGHSLIELVAAMACSAVLLAGLGSVMLIARQIAYVPTAATVQIEVAAAVQQIVEELRYAKWIIEQSDNAIEFVVADRDGDGRAERIRYEWSGTPGESLMRSLNGGAEVAVADNIGYFQLTYAASEDSVRLNPEYDSAEIMLASSGAVPGTGDRSISYTMWVSQQIDPTSFASIPAGATAWNATRVAFYGRTSGTTSETLLIQLRSSGNPHLKPTSETLATITVPESGITASADWNVRSFSSPVRGLSLSRPYSLVWASSNAGVACRLNHADALGSGVSESTNIGATWDYLPARRVYYRLYGTYSTPGTPVDVTRPYLAAATVVLQAANPANSRIESSVRLLNRPELIHAAWRADFEPGQPDPTAVDYAGDGTADWALASGGNFDASTVATGFWTVDSAIESRPANNFTGVTYIDARCRDGAVLRINADRQGGTFGPLIVRLSPTSTGQTLTLSGETATNVEKSLATVERLPNDWIRYQLLIVPQENIVQLTVDGREVGSYVYPTYAPSTTNRSITLSGNSAKFDYVEARIASEAVVAEAN